MRLIIYIYVSRSDGGRGIKQIRPIYETRIIAVRQQLLWNYNRNNLIQYIVNSEEQDIIGLLKNFYIYDISAMIITSNQDRLVKPSQNPRTYRINRITQIKKMHGFFHKKLINNDEIGQKRSCSRTKPTLWHHTLKATLQQFEIRKFQPNSWNIKGK